MSRQDPRDAARRLAKDAGLPEVFGDFASMIGCATDEEVRAAYNALSVSAAEGGKHADAMLDALRKELEGRQKRAADLADQFERDQEPITAAERAAYDRGER